MFSLLVSEGMTALYLLLNNIQCICKRNGEGPLYIACQNWHPTFANNLLDSDVNVNVCTNNGRSPLLVDMTARSNFLSKRRKTHVIFGLYCIRISFLSDNLVHIYAVLICAYLPKVLAVFVSLEIPRYFLYNIVYRIYVLSYIYSKIASSSL